MLTIICLIHFLERITMQLPIYLIGSSRTNNIVENLTSFEVTNKIALIFD